jgi:hypothetical protein
MQYSDMHAVAQGKQMVHDPYETYVGDMCTSITRQIWGEYC